MVFCPSAQGAELPLLPCHANRHAGPHRAVREVEVNRLRRSFTTPLVGPACFRRHLTPALRIVPMLSIPSRSVLHQRSSADCCGLCSILAPARHRCPFRHEARSPQIRAHSFPARTPDLRRSALVTGASRSFARSPAWQRLLSGSCSSARSFAPRFLPTPGRPGAVALHFTRSDLSVTGLSPLRMCPCWAYKKAAG